MTVSPETAAEEPSASFVVGVGDAASGGVPRLGTVGKGCGLELLRFLAPGDVVELEIKGIGVLRNRIVRE
jgi:2-keto-4-pentenoate hydratase/2-oxohepta-3-ene-1,7-dioic acid hydratase in catechol pathway